MRAVIYTTPGGPEVLELVDREIPAPGPKEVLVRVHVSGVNPTDWKSRRALSGSLAYPEIVPNQDGSGVITAVGKGVSEERIGERVWIYEACHGRAFGTAQEYIAIEQKKAVRLRDDSSFDLGASLGIPALTAHRCLTAGDRRPERLGPKVLQGETVLVAGGAGAVGHFAVQLAHWSGARVITTVSNEEKSELAKRAGADETVNYRAGGVIEKIRSLAPEGVDLIVEVSSVINHPINSQVLKEGGTIAIYASGDELLALDIRSMMRLNAGIEFIYTYTVARAAKRASVKDVSRALRDGALGVGEEHGLPLIRFGLGETDLAHRCVEDGATGKVVIHTLDVPH
ncbi:MAG TPA: NADPH:quinone reductase [Acidimicrobiales bacterium]|nr:NADPH:quinone reductase [Acidimicrobiales bacterium]